MAFPPIKASAKGGKEFELVPQGVHLAICKEVIHLGVQAGSGKYPDRDKVYIAFEVPSVRVTWEKGGKKFEGPAKIGQKFTLSLNEKSNLRPFLVAWRGQEFTKDEEEAFDITRLLGKICQLSVVHEKSDKKTYAKISGAFPLIKEQKDRLAANPKEAELEGEAIAYSPDHHDQNVFDKLPGWMQEMIEARVIPADAATAETANKSQDFDDDIPF